MDAPPIEPRPLPPEAASVLAAVEGKRGYLLPYHRMFAASAPELLRTYDAFYESLTLVPRILSPSERETVWAGLLAAAREVHGFIHMKRAVKAGLTPGRYRPCRCNRGRNRRICNDAVLGRQLGRLDAARRPRAGLSRDI